MPEIRRKSDVSMIKDIKNLERLCLFWSRVEEGNIRRQPKNGTLEMDMEINNG